MTVILLTDSPGQGSRLSVAGCAGVYEGVKVFTWTDNVIAKASPASHSHSCSHVSTGHIARGDNVVLHCQISPRTGAGRGWQELAGADRSYII